MLVDSQETQPFVGGKGITIPAGSKSDDTTNDDFANCSTKHICLATCFLLGIGLVLGFFVGFMLVDDSSVSDLNNDQEIFEHDSIGLNWHANTPWNPKPPKKGSECRCSRPRACASLGTCPRTGAPPRPSSGSPYPTLQGRPPLPIA